MRDGVHPLGLGLQVDLLAGRSYIIVKPKFEKKKNAVNAKFMELWRGTSLRDA